MLKAWEKVQKYAGEIANFKAWLTRLTHNLCVDIHRERSRDANRVENIEAIPEERELVSFDDTPESAMDTGEKTMVIRRAIWWSANTEDLERNLGVGKALVNLCSFLFKR